MAKNKFHIHQCQAQNCQALSPIPQPLNPLGQTPPQSHHIKDPTISPKVTGDDIKIMGATMCSVRTSLIFHIAPIIKMPADPHLKFTSPINHHLTFPNCKAQLTFYFSPLLRAPESIKMRRKKIWGTLPITLKRALNHQTHQ